MSALTMGAPIRTAPASPEAKDAKAQRRIEDAATQFESLMISQLLEPMTKMNGDDSSSSNVLDMGKDQLAQAITAGGGIGLKQTILASLKRG